MQSCLVLFSYSRVGFLKCEVARKNNLRSVLIHVELQ